MNWNTKKLEENDTSSFLTFEVIKKDKKGIEKREIKKENTFSYQVRMFIKDFEGFSEVKDKTKGEPAYPYYDSEGIPTIGYGFNLTDQDVFDAVFDAVFTNLLQNVCNSHTLEVCNVIKAKNTNLEDLDTRSYQQCANLVSNFRQAFWAGKWKNKNAKASNQELQNKIQEAIKEYLHTQKEFSLTKKQAQNILVALLYKKIKTIADSREIRNKTTRENIIKSFIGSSEGVALLSLYYNNPSLIGERLKNAYAESDRFKMWFEIRYNSNGGKDMGIAKRRFAESNVFGLFEDTKRGGYANTVNWDESEVDLKETMKFFSSLHSKFEKEEKKSYFEYLKYYENGELFGGTTILNRIEQEDTNNKPDLKHHFRSHTEVFSPFVRVFNQSMENAGYQYDFTLEEILVVNKDNRARIEKMINAKSKNKELAIILEKDIDIGFREKIKNSNTLHIILSLDNHIDCSGFEYSKKLAFYTLRNNQITKLEGCKDALKPQGISFQDTIIKGLMQINQDEEMIYCFKEQSNENFSPNLSIYDKKTFYPVATIYNLRSKENNNA